MEPTCHLSFAGEQLMNKMNDSAGVWHEEFSKYMLESMPSEPYSDLLSAEDSMRSRRSAMQTRLSPSQRLLSLGNFPRLGCKDAYPPGDYTNEGLESRLFPNEAIASNVRFMSIARNIKARRGCKVGWWVPIASSAVVDSLEGREEEEEDVLFDVAPNSDEAGLSERSLKLDSMGLGMGCCSTQVTVQLPDLPTAMRIYDQLSVVAPLLLALSASSPIIRGRLTEWDCKWNCVAASVDDRTPEEIARNVFPHSRFGPIDCYLCDSHQGLNDVPLALHQPSLELFRRHGLPEPLAQHMAHLLARDPLVIYREQAERYGLLDLPAGSPPLLPIGEAEHLYVLNVYLGCIWGSVRLKMPPAMLDTSGLGWRVEFRTMEAQPSDRENAALCTFVVLLTQALLLQSDDQTSGWLIPITLSHENMRRACLRDAIRTQRFYWATQDEKGVAEMTAAEIFLGSDRCRGLLPLVKQHLLLQREEHPRLASYLELIEGRATGRLPTPAAWMRQFCEAHPDYGHDSVCSLEMCRDLIEATCQKND